MILRCLHVFYGILQQNLYPLHVYSGVARVKVGIECVLFFGRGSTSGQP